MASSLIFSFNSCGGVVTILHPPATPSEFDNSALCQSIRLGEEGTRHMPSRDRRRIFQEAGDEGTTRAGVLPSPLPLPLPLPLPKANISPKSRSNTTRSNSPKARDASPGAYMVMLSLREKRGKQLRSKKANPGMLPSFMIYVYGTCLSCSPLDSRGVGRKR